MSKFSSLPLAACRLPLATLCLLIVSATSSHANPGQSDEQVPAPGDVRAQLPGGLTPTCIGGVFPQSQPQQPGTPPPRQAQCMPQPLTVFVNGMFFNYRTNILERVTVEGPSARPMEHVVCTGPRCEMILGGIGAAIGQAAGQLGMSTVQFVAKLATSKLQKCGYVKNDPAITLDFDASDNMEYFYAYEAVMARYGSDLATLKLAHEVDIYYPSTRSTFTFVLDNVLPPPKGRQFTMRAPREAEKNGPCAKGE